MRKTAGVPHELQQVAERCEAVGCQKADTLHATEGGGCCLAAAGRKVGAECFASEETIWPTKLQLGFHNANRRADLCSIGTNDVAPTLLPTNPPPPQAGGDMGTCLGITGDGASKKSRSGSSKMESTARMATAAPPKPPLELFEEADDLFVTL